MKIVNADTGVILLDTEAGIADLPPLRDANEIAAEMRQVFWRMELVARLLGERNKQLNGYRTTDDDGETFHAGVATEYAEAIEQTERSIWHDHKEGRIEKWPSESVRRAQAHNEMDRDKRLKYEALRQEVKNLEAYQRVLGDQMEGLRSLLSYHKEEAKADSHVFPDGDFAPDPHPVQASGQL